MEYDTKFTNTARYKCLEYLRKQSVELYLSYCGDEVCDPGHAYGPTIRTDYLMHYILSGKGTFTTQGKTYELKKHQAFLIYPRVETFYQADEEDPWHYIWVGFNGIRAEACMSHANFSQEHPIVEFENEGILYNCIKQMLASSQLTYANDLKRESCLYHFLATLIEEQYVKNATDKIRDYPFKVYVDHAIEFIAHNYASNVRINDIANYIGINRSYLTNCFKRSLNMSPQEYLIQFRINKACSLLKSTKDSIHSIAAQVGYENPLVFSKAFKTFIGISPKSYRNEEEHLVKA